MAAEKQGSDDERALAEAHEATNRAWDQWVIENRRALRAELERDALRARLVAVRETLTKDRVILVERRNGYRVENYSNPLVPVKAIEAALAELADEDAERTLSELADRQAAPNGLEGVL